MTRHPLPRNASVVCRMGHAGVVAAVALREDGVDRCVGIVAPGYDLGGRWSVIEQVDVDPREPNSGVSGVEGYDTEEAAIGAFEDIVTGSSAGAIRLPSFVVAAPTRRGNQLAYLAHNFGGGVEGFTHLRAGASVAWTASEAKRLMEAARGPVMRGYHSSDRIVMDEFRVYDSIYDVRRVDLSSVGMHSTEKPPSGWRLVVSNPFRSVFAAPDRHWANHVNVDEAMPFLTLGEAIDVAQREEMEVALVSFDVGNSPIPLAKLDEMIDEERRLVVPKAVPVADIGSGAWRPR